MQNDADLNGSGSTILTLSPLAYKFPLLETVVVLAHQETEKCKLKFTQDFRLTKNKKKSKQSNEAVTDFRDGLRYYNIIVLFFIT
jgi:hypothetical protein